MRQRNKLAFVLAACTAMASMAGIGVYAEEESHDPITVTWLNSYNEDGISAWSEWVKETVEEKYPYITLDMQTYSSDSIDQIVKTKIASDDAPGIFGGFNVQEYVDAGYVYDLSGEEWISNIQDEVLSAGVSGDTQAYVPMDTNYYGLFYNKDIFEELELEVPTTLTELYAVCDTLQENGIAPFACGFGDIWTLQEQMSPIYMTLCMGGYGGFEADKTWYEDKESLTDTFADDEAYARSFEILYSLRDYFSDDPMATDWATALNMVATGQAAMIANGSWTMDGVLSINPDVNMSAFPMPVSDDPADSVVIAQPGSGPLCYNSEDPEMLDACLKVFEVMYSVESGQKYAEMGNKISTFKEVDMSFNTSCNDLMEYVNNGQCWSNGDIVQFQGGGYGIIQARLQEYLMKDELDVEGFLSALDADFKAAY
ncbi:MAG: extracellular solute-binding protein [Eubacteriales bacterium]|nr:extracellular solute-binding protein [Eubacteriales bacterium]